MADVVFVVVAAGFFVVCVLYVRAADRMVRRGAESAVETVGHRDVPG